MRKKTETRREAILAAAAAEFAERGYEGASMSAIVSRVGGSKQTLYNYFPSKAELFVELVIRAVARQIDDLRGELSGDGDLGGALVRYGERYLTGRQSPDIIALRRRVYSEAGREEIGRPLYEQARKQVIAHLAEFLGGAMRAGTLRAADPRVAAVHFVALLEADLVDELTIGLREPAAPDEVATITRQAVEAFLGAYAPNRTRHG